MNEINETIIINNLKKHNSSAIEMLEHGLAAFCLLTNYLSNKNPKATDGFESLFEDLCKENNLNYFDFMLDCNKDMEKHFKTDDCKKD